MLEAGTGTAEASVAALLGRAEQRGEQWGSVVETFLVVAVLFAAAALIVDGHPSHGALGGALGLVFLALWAIRVWYLRCGIGCPAWLALGSAVLQGLVVGWVAAEVVPDQPGFALSAFIVLLGLHSLRLRPRLVVVSGALYSFECLLLGLLHISRLMPHFSPLPDSLRVGLLVLVSAFLWYFVRSVRSVLRYHAEGVAQREQALRDLAQDLDRQVQDRTRRLRAAVAQEATLRERQRIATDLHDGLAKSIAGFSLQLQALSADRSLQPGLKEEITRLGRLSGELANEARRTLTKVRGDIGGGGVEDQIADVARRFTAETGISVEVVGEGAFPEVPADVLWDLRSIALEGLDNVLRHSAATRARIRLRSLAEGIELSVEDDGRGLQADWSWQALRSRNRFGLLGIVERSERHGGVAHVDRHSPMGGCRVVVQVPTKEVSV